MFIYFLCHKTDPNKNIINIIEDLSLKPKIIVNSLVDYSNIADDSNDHDEYNFYLG